MVLLKALIINLQVLEVIELMRLKNAFKTKLSDFAFPKYLRRNKYARSRIILRKDKGTK